MAGLFALGQVVATRGVVADVPFEDQLAALLRHVMGDAGLMPPEDAKANRRAIREGERIVSKYATDDGTKFYVVTEWDRSLTTIMLTDEY